MNRSIRGTLAVTVVAIVAMAFASVAGAAVTESHVDAPGSPHFSIVMPGVETVAVSGTTNGTTGDEVDLQCYYKGTSRYLLAKEIAVAANGSFSVPNAELEKISDSACILRAVPTGTEPSSLATYTGPLMATGENDEKRIESGPNIGRLFDYYVWAQQQTAAFDYVSAGNCGIYDGYLFDSSQKLTTTTFYCNDGFYQKPGEFNRSAILVDGTNAYVSDGAISINNEATNLPAFSYSVSQDPTNGDTTIQESEAISACSTPTYPATKASCPSFVETGVRLDRTIVQSNDGHLATITDHFVSVYGKPHSVDTLTENDQNFNNNGGKWNTASRARPATSSQWPNRSWPSPTRRRELSMHRSKARRTAPPPRVAERSSSPIPLHRPPSRKSATRQASSFSTRPRRSQPTAR